MLCRAHHTMARLAWPLVIATVAACVASAAAQDQCTVTVRIPSTHLGSQGGYEATINMVRLHTTCTCAS